MKVMIDIPKEFERDLQDKFNEFFERVKCDINSLWELQEVSMCGNYERETVEMFLSAFEKATPIPDNATNGDVFEILLDTEPNTFLKFDENFNDGKKKVLRFDKAWWNAPYKKGAKE